MDEPTNVIVYRGEERIAFYKDIADSELGANGVLLVTTKDGAVNGWSPYFYSLFEVGVGLE